MSDMHAIVPSLDALASSAGLVLGVVVLTCYFLHPLAGIPGPLRAQSGLGGWQTVRAAKRDFGWKLAELHDRHGAFVRIGRNSVSVVDPAAKVTSPSLLATLDHDEHNLARRGVSPAFSMNLLLDLEEFVDSAFDDFIATSGKSRATIDLGTMLQFLAMDVVGELAFGQGFGLSKAGRDTGDYLPMLDAYTASACLSGTQPWARPILHRWLTRKLGSSGAAALGAKASVAVSRRLAELDKAAQAGDDSNLRKDVLSKLMSAKNPDGSPFSIAQVKVQANSILGAGSDTTSITFRALLAYIVRDPAVYNKVMQELEGAAEEGIVSLPLSYAAAQKLDYFQACLKETLRLHPAVPWVLPRIIPPGGASVACHHFAAGVEVAMSPYVFPRRKEAYGDDAEMFRPERWLEATAEEKKRFDRNLLTFGQGNRICVGKNIALMELSKLAPSVLYRYNLAFTPRRQAGSPHTLPGRAIDGRLDDKEPWHCESQWFSHQKDFWVDVSIRSGSQAM
ncbi:hypothetical protein BMF94_6204 [Rhodotorula taiwanensis]|uniref:Cytochrome P450 n=1 Tax=Rhodotorula taiwanensis TaxID=741276 RepID=A0A2S5B1Y0_9BASI|nr:hypothetical protein BMF94_6204 [Rhodotorula taiwanensis]